MQRFDEIEEKYAVAHVRVCSEEDLVGVLRVAQRETAIDLLSRKFFHLERSQNGWFDLELMGPDGRKIFAHNAIAMSKGKHQPQDHGTTHFASVHPNILVMDSRGLDSDRRVAAVHFQVEGLKNFFYYQYTEPLDCSGISEEARATLLGMRYDQEQEKDFNEPAFAFIVHELKEVLEFRVEKRLYRVWMGGNESYSWGQHFQFRIRPTAAILFDEPVTIEEALNRVWEWRRFFVQLAMQHLNFEAVGFLASHDDRAAVGSVYLPNIDKRKAAEGHYKLGPACIPLNSWNEREALSVAMRTWLEQSDTRKAFRARLDQVIDKINRRTDQMDIIELSAGIDSLAELDQKESYPEGAVAAMAEAAGSAAADHKVALSVDRLRSILAQLQRRSLAEKMRELGRRAMPEVDIQDIELVISTARKCRDDATHRGAVSEQRQSQVGPVVEALASMCVAFDLRDAGVPRRSSNASSCYWVIRFSDALAELKRQLG